MVRRTNFTIIAGGKSELVLLLLRRWLIQMSSALMFTLIKFPMEHTRSSRTSSCWTGMPCISRHSRRPYCSRSFTSTPSCSTWFCRLMTWLFSNSFSFRSPTFTASIFFWLVSSSSYLALMNSTVLTRSAIFYSRSLNLLSRIIFRESSVILLQGIGMVFNIGKEIPFD